MPTAWTIVPWGGTDYSNAVEFDAAWVYGCLTGTSCNGGTHFDNRAPCEPDANVDTCAPQPTGSTAARLGSDVWYRFVAPDTTAFIQVLKNVSLMATIQTFKDSGNCAGLVELDVAYSATPSGPVNVLMNNLIIGDTYVFRVFGHSKPASQRTGIFCFCGSTGLWPSTTLPIDLVSFEADLINDRTVNLKWMSQNAYNFSHFELQQKIDNGEFKTIEYIRPESRDQSEFAYTHILNTSSSNIQYRLKMMDENGEFTYSPTRSIFKIDNGVVKIVSASQSLMHIFTKKNTLVTILGTDGKQIQSTQLNKGLNNISVLLSQGVYLLKESGGLTQRLVVQ